MKKLLILSALFIIACNSEPKLISYENLYEIELPGDMTPMTSEINGDASIQYANLFKEKYFMIIHESKSDLIGYLGEEDYFGKFVEVKTNSIEDSFNGLSKTKNITLNGSTNGVMLEIEGKIDDSKIIWNTIFVEGKSNLYQLCFWTLINRDYNMDELLLSARTFREF